MGGRHESALMQQCGGGVIIARSERNNRYIAGPERIHSSLKNQLAIVNNADRSSDLLNLGEQMTGEENGYSITSGQRDFINSRTSPMPAGTSPFVGSSSMSSLGKEMSAMAIPSRCFMPRE